MPKGNYGAYRQLTPITTNFGDLARNAERMQLAKDEEQRRRDRDAENDMRYDEQQAEKINDKRAARDAKFRPIIAGIDTWDKAAATGIYASVERLGEIDEILRQDPL